MTATRPADLTAFDTLRIRFKPRVSCERRRVSSAFIVRAVAAPFSRTTTPSKSYPARHTYHARARIARRSYSSATALYGFPYSARVSAAIVLAARARGNPGDFYSSIRARSSSRSAYTEVTAVLWRVPASPRARARASPQLCSPFYSSCVLFIRCKGDTRMPPGGRRPFRRC